MFVSNNKVCPLLATDIATKRYSLLNTARSCSRAASTKRSHVQLFVIYFIITNNTGTYLIFCERILCLFIINIIGILSFDRQFIKVLRRCFLRQGSLSIRGRIFNSTTLQSLLFNATFFKLRLYHIRALILLARFGFDSKGA